MAGLSVTSKSSGVSRTLIPTSPASPFSAVFTSDARRLEISELYRYLSVLSVWIEALDANELEASLNQWLAPKPKKIGSMVGVIGDVRRVEFGPIIGLED